jgi:hypothetical protein
MLEAAEKEIDDTNRGRLKFQLGTIEEVDKLEGKSHYPNISEIANDN